MIRNISPYFLIVVLNFAVFLPAQNRAVSMHLFVALCDNDSQGIVPVPARMGNGDDPANNLYWGMADGVKGFFSRDPGWELVSSSKSSNLERKGILERCFFKRVGTNFFLVADAYRGSRIRDTTRDFLTAAIIRGNNLIRLTNRGVPYDIPAGSGADFTAYIGHNGLMDFDLMPLPRPKRAGLKKTAVICCRSETYFEGFLRENGAIPFLMTRQLMYPGAFILAGVLDGLLKGETREQVRERAAAAYALNQKISVKSARGIFSIPR